MPSPGFPRRNESCGEAEAEQRGNARQRLGAAKRPSLPRSYEPTDHPHITELNKF